MKKAHWMITTLMAPALGIATLGVTGCGKYEREECAATKYTCSMHPEVVQDKAGDCPKCGMKLTERK